MRLNKFKKRLKSFSLAEAVLALTIVVIVLAASMPLMTIRKKIKDFDFSSIACIKSDQGNITSAACLQSINYCRYNQNDACKTLAFFADYGNATYQNASRSVIRETCDQGGES